MGHARRDTNEVRAAPARFRHRHRGADAEDPRLVARRRNDTATGATYDDRFAAQFGIVTLLDGRIECVHVDVQDDARGHCFICPGRR